MCTSRCGRKRGRSWRSRGARRVGGSVAIAGAAGDAARAQRQARAKAAGGRGEWRGQDGGVTATTEGGGRAGGGAALSSSASREREVADFISCGSTKENRSARLATRYGQCFLLCLCAIQCGLIRTHRPWLRSRLPSHHQQFRRACNCHATPRHATRPVARACPLFVHEVWLPAISRKSRARAPPRGPSLWAFSNCSISRSAACAFPLAFPLARAPEPRFDLPPRHRHLFAANDHWTALSHSSSLPPQSTTAAYSLLRLRRPHLESEVQGERTAETHSSHVEQTTPFRAGVAQMRDFTW